MYCKNCGNKLRANSTFCPKCGKKVLKEKDKDEDKEVIEASFKEKEEKEEKKTKTVEKENREEEKDVMYCKNCGKEISIDAKICPKCGYNLKGRVSTVDSFTNFVICAVSFFIPIVGFILWVVLRNENNNKAKNALIASCIGLFMSFLLTLLVIVFVVVVLIS